MLLCRAARPSPCPAARAAVPADQQVELPRGSPRPFRHPAAVGIKIQNTMAVEWDWAIKLPLVPKALLPCVFLGKMHLQLKPSQPDPRLPSRGRPKCRLLETISDFPTDFGF
ncbi:hypothetical protein EJB05_01596, partial [Eragrostis curvula]